MNETIDCTQDSESDWGRQFNSDELSAEMEYEAQKHQDEDIIQTYLQKTVTDLVKAHLAVHSEEIIALAIKAYVLSESNRKREEKYKMVHAKKSCLGKK